MVTHTEARTFKISKFENLLEKPWNPPGITRICENLEHDAITVSDLVRNWSISTQISYSWCNLAKQSTSNLIQRMSNKSEMDYWQK